MHPPEFWLFSNCVISGEFNEKAIWKYINPNMLRMLLIVQGGITSTTYREKQSCHQERNRGMRSSLHWSWEISSSNTGCPFHYLQKEQAEHDDTAVIPSLGNMRQENQDLEAGLGSIEIPVKNKLINIILKEK